MPIKKERLSDQVILEVKKIIHDKGYTPGDKFYSEGELVNMFAVSRSSIREAIRSLEVSGVLTVQQGKGIFIADPHKEEHHAFAQWLQKNETSLEEHFEMRLIIDPKAASYAARKADKSDIRKLEDICDAFRQMVGKESAIEIIKLDEQFHLQLAKSTKNRTLYMIMKTMTESLSEGWISSLNVPGRIEKTVHEHQDIIEAIKLQDSALAEQRMETHLRNALEEIHATMQEKKAQH